MIDTSRTFNFETNEWDLNSEVFTSLRITQKDLEQLKQDTAISGVPFEYMLGAVICGHSGITVTQNNEGGVLCLPSGLEYTDSDLYNRLTSG